MNVTSISNTTSFQGNLPSNKSLKQISAERMSAKNALRNKQIAKACVGAALILSLFPLAKAIKTEVNKVKHITITLEYENINERIAKIAQKYNMSEKFIKDYNEMIGNNISETGEIKIPSQKYNYLGEKIQELEEYAKEHPEEQKEIEKEITKLKAKKETQDEIADCYIDGNRLYFHTKRIVDIDYLKLVFDIEDGAFRKEPLNEGKIPYHYETRYGNVYEGNVEQGITLTVKTNATKKDIESEGLWNNHHYETEGTFN